MEFVFVKRIVDEWAKQGHQCVVVTFFPLTTYLRGRIGYKPRHHVYEVAQGCVVQVYHPRTIALGSVSINGVSINRWIESKVFNRLIKRIGIQFDFMYCHFFSSALSVYRFARFNSIPLFVATGESAIPELDKPYKLFSFEEFREYTHGVIAVSSKNKNEAIERGLIDPEKCQVFPNGADLSVFRPLDRQVCRKELNLPQDAFIISCVGYFCERKGQNRLLEAVRRLENRKIKILFIGEASKTDAFPLFGNEILFKGPVENCAIPRYLCASDVFCLPTKAEGCCNAIIEALACGRPVISSNLSFNWDILNETNSRLINPNSIAELANTIDQLYHDKKLLINLSEGARSTASLLSVEQRAIHILSFIESLLFT